MNLGQIVVGQEEMNLAGEVAFELSRADEGDPASLSAGGVEMVAVNQFVQDEMALGMISQVGDPQP